MVLNLKPRSGLGDPQKKPQRLFHLLSERRLYQVTPEAELTKLTKTSLRAVEQKLNGPHGRTSQGTIAQQVPAGLGQL